MIAWSLSLTPLVVTSRSLEFCSLTFSSSALTSSAVTFVSTFSISTPRYLPSVTSGLTATVAVKIKSLPFSICVISISGCETISSPHSAAASEYAEGIA